eukprot:scaffold642418_cov22-Prasinocladus_malaysianus.AAC.1
MMLGVQVSRKADMADSYSYSYVIGIRRHARPAQQIVYGIIASYVLKSQSASLVAQSLMTSSAIDALELAFKTPWPVQSARQNMRIRAVTV